MVILPNYQAAIVFVDDNARLHRSGIVLERLESLGIETLQLPSRLPDLNPIEHACDMLKRRLSNHQPHSNTLPVLRAIILPIYLKKN